MLQRSVEHSDPTQRAELAQQAVCVALSLDVTEIRSPTQRKREIARARQVAMYVAHVVLGLSLAEVGRAFHRDRSMAAYACRVVEQWRENASFDSWLHHMETSLATLVGERERSHAHR